MLVSPYRKLKKELHRIGFSDVMLRDGERVLFEHLIHSSGKLPWRDAATPLRWEGIVSDALDLLATLPNDADDFWSTFCPEAEPYHRDKDTWTDEQHRLEEELRRFGRLRPRATFHGYDVRRFARVVVPRNHGRTGCMRKRAAFCVRAASRCSSTWTFAGAARRKKLWGG